MIPRGKKGGPPQPAGASEPAGATPVGAHPPLPRRHHATASHPRHATKIQDPPPLLLLLTPHAPRHHSCSPHKPPRHTFAGGGRFFFFFLWGHRRPANEGACGVVWGKGGAARPPHPVCPAWAVRQGRAGVQVRGGAGGTDPDLPSHQTPLQVHAAPAAAVPDERPQLAALGGSCGERWVGAGDRGFGRAPVLAGAPRPPPRPRTTRRRHAAAAGVPGSCPVQNPHPRPAPPSTILL